MDLGADYLLIDDPITVTYASRTSVGVWAAGVAITYAQRNEITNDDIAVHGALLDKEATVFHVWTARLFGIVPKQNDKVLYASRVYQVHAVAEMDRDANGVQRYRLIVLRVPTVTAL